MARQVDPMRLWLLDRFTALDLQISTGGRFASIVDGKLYIMAENHVKSLLRRDYIEANGNVPGLNRALNELLADGKEAAKTIPLTGAEHIFEEAWKLPT